MWHSHGDDNLCCKTLTASCHGRGKCFNPMRLAVPINQNVSRLHRMTLAPSITDLLARARADLRMGVPVVIADGSSAGVVATIETLSQARFDALRALGGDVSLAITARRAETLRARAYDGDLARVILPVQADLRWVKGIADPAGDLGSPMKGPFQTRRDGLAQVHRAAIALAKSARLLPALIVVDLADADAFAQQHLLTVVSAHAARDTDLSPLHAVIAARVPLAVSDKGRVHVFRPDDGGEEHYAIEIGTPDRDRAVLSRLHSACFTGDLMGSLKCDCGPQLRAALAMMGENGSGVLLYLNQEGRGIGLANKMRAYSLQDQGFDTVEANHRLGFDDDERDFRIGADILKRLGFNQTRLMTNNPAKVARMEACGVTVVERVPLKVGQNKQNAGYLATKAAKSGHLL